MFERIRACACGAIRAPVTSHLVWQTGLCQERCPPDAGPEAQKYAPQKHEKNLLYVPDHAAGLWLFSCKPVDPNNTALMLGRAAGAWLGGRR